MYAAPFDNDNRITEPKHNSTQKNHSKQHNNTRKSSSGKVNVLLEQIHNQSDFDDNDEQTGGGLADFNPVPKPISAGVTRTIERDTPIDDLSVGEDEEIPSQYAKQYYQQYAPTFNSNSVPASNIGVGGGGGEQSNMIEKMNYMIHLLEEQQDQKTNHVTEEIILYSFLGVFVIFVVDSFARVGKYVR